MLFGNCFFIPGLARAEWVHCQARRGRKQRKAQSSGGAGVNDFACVYMCKCVCVCVKNRLTCTMTTVIAHGLWCKLADTFIASPCTLLHCTCKKCFVSTLYKVNAPSMQNAWNIRCVSLHVRWSLECDGSLISCASDIGRTPHSSHSSIRACVWHTAGV